MIPSYWSLPRFVSFLGLTEQTMTVSQEESGKCPSYIPIYECTLTRQDGLATIEEEGAMYYFIVIWSPSSSQVVLFVTTKWAVLSCRAHLVEQNLLYQSERA